MNRIFLLLLLGCFTALWAYYVMQPQESLAPYNPGSYESYLQDALKRNETQVQYNQQYIFYKEDFIDIESYPNDGNYEDHHFYNPYSWKYESHVVWGTGYHSRENSQNLASWDTTHIAGTTESENQGNFWTPPLPWGYAGQTNCSGLIYNPCIVLSLTPEPATGGMYFGSDRVYN